MNVKDIIFGDIVNYKKISMTVMMPKCDFKCDRECGQSVCQNSSLVNLVGYEVDPDYIIKQYYTKQHGLMQALVFQGLEPFDTFDDLLEFITIFRNHYEDDIIIYTGYNEDEIKKETEILKTFKNIIIKFGRFVPNQESHYDDILGVKLSSPNQYAKKIS